MNEEGVDSADGFGLALQALPIWHRINSPNGRVCVPDLGTVPQVGGFYLPC